MTALDIGTLRPCPFCGGDAKFVPDDSYGSCWVTCSQCDCGPDGCFRPIGEELLAVATWNHRPGYTLAYEAGFEVGKQVANVRAVEWLRAKAKEPTLPFKFAKYAADAFRAGEHMK